MTGRLSKAPLATDPVLSCEGDFFTSRQIGVAAVKTSTCKKKKNNPDLGSRGYVCASGQNDEAAVKTSTCKK